MRYARAKLINDRIISVVQKDNEDIYHEVENILDENLVYIGKTYDAKDLNFVVPCNPTKIVAVGLNYSDHAKELNLDIPKEPIIFLKPVTTIIANNEKVIYPSMSKQVDYEAELAVVIKKQAKNIEIKNVGNYILGYTCCNDVTARDLQKKDGQWTRAKSFDTFSPVGPWIVDKIKDNAFVSSYLNDTLKQKSSLENLIFDVKYIVNFISKIMTLMPGDIIMTGTPKGIGPMKIGDKIEVQIEGIGSLINYVSE